MVLLAICIRHEMDHLVGKLFIDYLSPLKQQRIRQKVRKTRLPPERGQGQEPTCQIHYVLFLRVHLTLQRDKSRRC